MIDIGLPWTEKYRPKRLKDVVGHKPIVKRLEAYAEMKNMPNMLFAGMPGIGKTVCSVAMANEIFGDTFAQNFLELNASDERGIDVIRGKIKDFAATLPYGGADFKIIFLDEADALTRDAQNALRRTMENYSRTCRFVLSCVAPDTKIVMPDETEMTIADFEYNFEGGSLALDENDYKVKKDKVLCYMSLNPKTIGKKSLRLKTMTGRHLDVTEDHPILTPNGWIKAGEIKLGSKVAVFPHLEGTGFVKDERIVLDEVNMEWFIDQYEVGGGYSKNAKQYGKLTTDRKKTVIKRVKELHKTIPNNLTKKEKEIFDIIVKADGISTSEIREKTELSRARANQHLKSIEEKGAIKRTIDKNNKRVHRFKAIREDAGALRNDADIKRKIEEEFKIKISYSSIKNIITGKENERYHANYIISELKNKNLLPISYSNKNMGVIARLTGFLLGDGHITKANKRLIFNGDKNSLEEIRADIIKIGFLPSKVISKQLTNTIRGRIFTGTTTWFYIDSLPLALFFRSLGVPNGDKCLQEFCVPDWIMKGSKLAKREFIRGVFGSEMDSPRCVRKNFNAITFRQHKIEELTTTAEKFHRQLMELLTEFGITSKLKTEKLGYKRKTGQEMHLFKITLDSSNKNIYNFLRQIGYAYSTAKEREGRLAAEYLKHKLHSIKLREELASEILIATNGGYSKRSVARNFGCSVDFVINQTKGKDASLQRSFPNYKEWKKEYAIKNSKLAWNEITTIEDIELNDVRDFTCLTNHNFIANGIISHNCNYSSKIIEPIQSRCALFRFKPLPEEEITKRLEFIAKNEGLHVDKNAYEALVYASEGDMRKAINYLQTSSALKEKITEDAVYKVAARAKPQEVKKLLELGLKGEFAEARKMLDALLFEYGMSGEEVILQVYKEVITSDAMDDLKKIELIDRIGEYNFRITEGANERIQLESLLAHLVLLGKK